MTRLSTTLPGARIGLFLAAVVLLPGVLALFAAGTPGVPATGLALTEAAGAFSVAALQGLERRLTDGPATACVPPTPAASVPPAERAHPFPSEGAPATIAPSRPLPLRL